VFVPGLKGTHLSRPLPDANTDDLDESKISVEKKRVWLTIPNLLNFPPRSSSDPYVDLSLPLTYIHDEQCTGDLVPDGVINYILESNANNFELNFFPFYAHANDLLSCTGAASNYDHKRPSSTFEYDWRLDLNTLAKQLHEYCCKTYPDKPVQLLAHSMGGLLAFYLWKKYPEKYKPGAVLVGVPFGTGVQYLQDLQLGYKTELGTCQQFSPEALFTFGSHWSFFPSDKDFGDLIVDVTETNETDLPEGFEFQAGKNTIGQIPPSYQPEGIKGETVNLDFYNWKEWESNQFGIFDPVCSKQLGRGKVSEYREHLKIQLKKAVTWRSEMTEKLSEEKSTPSLTVCATNCVPTIHQILRRKNSENPDLNQYEYDFSSGRSVPGDGRIDFDKAFPTPQNDFQYDYKFKKVSLSASHTKQMCMEENGGNMRQIWDLVVEQLTEYQMKSRK